MFFSKLRYSWNIHNGTIPAQPHDAETIRLMLSNCAMPTGHLWRDAPPAAQESAWRHLIAPPIIDQMYRTKDPLGANPLRKLPEEKQQEVLNSWGLNNAYTYAFVFVAPTLTVANAYVERLLMTYALTTEKIPRIMTLASVLDEFRAFYHADSYELLLKPGLLLVSDVVGSITDIDRIDNKLVSFLSERHGRGKTTVFVIIAQEDIGDALGTHGFDKTIYKLVQTTLNIRNKAFGMYLMPENSYVYSYCIEKDGTYVCRHLVSE